MTKVFIDKKENVAQAVEKIIIADDASVVIVIPKNAELSSVPENFALLKREAEAASKHIFVESVDEEALAYAEQNGIEAIHPIFMGDSAARRALTDIVPREGNAEPVKRPRSLKGARTHAAKLPKKLVVRAEDEESEEEEEAQEQEHVAPRMGFGRMAKEKAETEEREEREERAVEHMREYKPEGDEPQNVPFRRKWKWAVRLVVLACAVGILAWGTGRAFGHATANLKFKKTAWNYAETVTVSKNATKTGNNIVPGEVFTDERNLTQLFPASSRAAVSKKAQGKLLVFNAYSSSPQSLVASTRFATPDGKVFRLDKALTVPGAGIKDGKITPASVEAAVTADQPGAEYNVGPVDKLTILGFKGTAKYDGFYGQLLGKTEGGFVGEKAVPTDDDIKKAKERTTEILRTSLSENIIQGKKDEFTVLPDTAEFTIVKLVVNQNADDSGNFSVFGEARVRIIAFRKADMEQMFAASSTAGNAALALTGLSVEYKNPNPDFGKGELKVGVTASGVVTAKFNEDEFKQAVSGKRIQDARAYVAGLPELVSANLSLWPFWLGSAPENPGRVKVVVE